MFIPLLNPCHKMKHPKMNVLMYIISYWQMKLESLGFCQGHYAYSQVMCIRSHLLI